MSLINQLLKDLEGRHAAGAEIKGIAPQARSLPERRLNASKPVISGLLGIVVVLLVFGLYHWQQRTLQIFSDRPSVDAAPSETVATQLPPSVLATQPSVAVEEALLAPIFQLSEELSFVPKVRAERQPVSKPKPVPATKAPAKVEQKPTPKPASATKAKEAPATVAAPSANTQAVVTQPAPVPVPPRQKPRQPEPVEEVLIAADLPPGPIEKQTRTLTAYEAAENNFRDGVARLRQGRLVDAEASFRTALREDRSHLSARQALISLLIDLHRSEDAEQVLRESLAVNPRQPRYAMLLARMELDRGDAPAAVKTLEAVKSYAGNDAEFYAFYAAAMQRTGRHAEAAELYRNALALSPGNAVWLMGLGISLRAAEQLDQAREAFRRAGESRALAPELQRFVDAQLLELGAGPR